MTIKGTVQEVSFKGRARNSSGQCLGHSLMVKALCCEVEYERFELFLGEKD